MELLVVISIVAVLTAMLLPAVSRAKERGKQARCYGNLRQLGLAVEMYLQDSQGRFFPYGYNADGGHYWYFGFEPNFGTGVPEGQRELDKTKAKLYPYLQTLGGIEVCPSFDYTSALWKPKFKGASYGYGMNLLLAGADESKWTRKSSAIVAFVDCAQVNTFQAPASPTNPLLEEFYFVDPSQKLVHFRHRGRANVLFCDGHVESMPMAPGTLDTNLPQANVGRLNANPLDNSLFE